MSRLQKKLRNDHLIKEIFIEHYKERLVSLQNFMHTLDDPMAIYRTQGEITEVKKALRLADGK